MDGSPAPSEDGRSPPAAAPESGRPGTRPRPRPRILTVQRDPARLRRPRCGSASGWRAFFSAPPREFLPASRSLGEGALGGVGRERPSGNVAILPPTLSLLPGVGGE